MKHLLEQLLRKSSIWGPGGLLLCLFVLSCNGDDDLSPDPREQSGGQIKFEIAFDGQDETKATTGTDFKAKWEPEDEIGLFAVKGTGSLLASGNYIDNMKLTRQSNGTWQATSPMYYPNDGDQLHFYAYYPYDAAMTDPLNYTFSVKPDQNDTYIITFNGIGYDRPIFNLSDLLLAKAENVAKSDNAVQLDFSHAMSLVQVEVKREVNVPHLDGDLTVTLTNAKPAAALGWTNELIGTGTLTDIVMHKVADATGYIYRALVPAQTLAADSKVTFVQNTTGKEIDMEYQGVKSTALTAKNAHKYSVTLGWGIDPNHTYAVGDVYPHTGPAIGIVYYIEPGSDGKHGKIVGLKENGGARWDDGDYNTGANDKNNGLNNMKKVREYISSQSKDWVNFPHFAWIHSMNDANEDYSDADAKGVWYLPAWSELGNFAGGLYQAKATINTSLTSAGGTTLSDNTYWSSSEIANGGAYSVPFGSGSYATDYKSSNYGSARCVLAF